MKALRDDIDPDGMREFSVVFTDRSLNHMSQQFQEVMRDIDQILKSVYNADHVAIVPGGGTYAMEAVARQLASDKNVLVLRNGWFSYRWSQIFETGFIPHSQTVLKARPIAEGSRLPFVPAPIEEVTATIAQHHPALVFAPHVETSSGMILPDNYIRDLANAVHHSGGLLILDCIASGCIWVDMKALGVDVLISAPQKGWSASPCAGLVMMNETARKRVDSTVSTSFAANLKTWSTIMDAYLNGGHAYHATMPTDALRQFRDTMLETREYGFDRLKAAQQALGQRVRDVLIERGIVSVAADGFGAPGVVVAYTDNPDWQNGSQFAQAGVQIAAGVPLQCDEPDDYASFRLGLFGLDKLYDVDATVHAVEQALDLAGQR